MLSWCEKVMVGGVGLCLALGLSSVSSDAMASSACAALLSAPSMNKMDALAASPAMQKLIAMSGLNDRFFKNAVKPDRREANAETIKAVLASGKYPELESRLVKAYERWEEVSRNNPFVAEELLLKQLVRQYLRISFLKGAFKASNTVFLTGADSLTAVLLPKKNDEFKSEAQAVFTGRDASEVSLQVFASENGVEFKNGVDHSVRVAAPHDGFIPSPVVVSASGIVVIGVNQRVLERDSSDKTIVKQMTALIHPSGKVHVIDVPFARLVHENLRLFDDGGVVIKETLVDKSDQSLHRLTFVSADGAVSIQDFNGYIHYFGSFEREGLLYACAKFTPKGRQYIYRLLIFNSDGNLALSQDHMYLPMFPKLLHGGDRTVMEIWARWPGGLHHGGDTAPTGIFEVGRKGFLRRIGGDGSSH